MNPVEAGIGGKEMQAILRHTKRALAALLLFPAVFLSGCGSGCGSLGVQNTSPCENGTTSTSSGYSISGGVSGSVLQSVLVSLTGAANASVSTDAGGRYSFTGLANGIYTVAPSVAGQTFKPASSVVTVSGANVSGNNFVESAYGAPTSGFSGAVSGAVMQNVIISLGGANSGSAVSNASGNYSFAGLAAGSYALAPSLSGYTFSPASTVATAIIGGTVTLSNFTATAYAGATSSVSGSVSGAVAQNVVMTLSGANTGSVLTDASGNYSISGLAAGTYTVTPSLAGYTFSPASNTVTTVGGDNVTVGNFTAAQ